MLALWICIGVTVLDQVSKFLVWDRMMLGDRIVLIDHVLNLTYVANTGAAWGMFQHRNFGLAILSLVVFVVLIVFRRSFLRDTLAHRICLGLMLGGILGNCLDRLRVHHVIDFVDFYWGTRHFPAFNVADAAICIGVGLYMLTELPFMRRGEVPVRGGEDAADV